MIYTIQDKEEDKMKYVATATTAAAADKIMDDLIVQDKEDGTYKKGRYKITKRGLCYSDASKKCGYCNCCVCMADDWESQCPARVRT